MPRRDETRDAKRARILEAAYRESERVGVARARMEDVAARARVSKGTLYNYFESKEHLLLATILSSYEQFLPLVEAEPEPGAGPREQLESYLDGLVKVLEEVAPRMNVHYQAWGLVAADPALKRQLYGFLTDFHEARSRSLEAIVRAGKAARVFRPDADVAGVGDAVQALLSGFLYRATFDPERAPASGLRRSFDVMVIHPLLHRAAPDGGPSDG
jgi:AcrR family transcriptional regulator